MSKILQKKLEDLLDSGELLQLVDEAYSCLALLRKLGYSENGRYNKLVKEFVIANDIDIKHWRQGGSYKIAAYLEKICPVCGTNFLTNEKVNSTTCGYSCANTYFRSGENNANYTGSKTRPVSGRLYREVAYKTYGKICNRCGFTNALALEVHHIDRDRSNNDLSNLEVLCSNCHSIEHKTPAKQQTTNNVQHSN